MQMIILIKTKEMSYDEISSLREFQSKLTSQYKYTVEIARTWQKTDQSSRTIPPHSTPAWNFSYGKQTHILSDWRHSRRKALNIRLQFAIGSSLLTRPAVVNNDIIITSGRQASRHHCISGWLDQVLTEYDGRTWVDVASMLLLKC